MGTHQNRLDAKGRVSIPAAFRAALRDTVTEHPDAEVATAVVLRPSHKYPCIECWPVAKFAALASTLDKLDPMSDEYADLSSSIYSDSVRVEADKEGRILLGADMVASAGLTGQVAFMGLGDTFQIWDPQAAERRRAEARAGTRQRELARSARSLA